jgi:hypothetical protein
VLAYVFWHHPQLGTPSEDYESAQVAFHRSLARRPPVGLRGSAAFRAPDTPWLQAPQGGYEDWYLVDDFAALGVLNEAAVGRGHRTAHDRAARHAGSAAGALYRLLEGEAGIAWEVGERCDAIWVAPAPGAREHGLGELLGDGMGEGGGPVRGGLWRRLLVLGPAPEYCLIAREASRGVADTRLPAGWTARTLERIAIFVS